MKNNIQRGRGSVERGGSAHGVSSIALMITIERPVCLLAKRDSYNRLPFSPPAPRLPSGDLPPGIQHYAKRQHSPSRPPRT
jgi:hypothetical protein